MAGWIVPKFSYWNGSAIVDFIPANPATKKTPYGPVVAVRHDSITTSAVGRRADGRVQRLVV